MIRHNLNKRSRFDFIKTGLLIIVISVFFMYDRQYFFYPPSFAPVWNNLVFDCLGFFAGLILLFCGVFGWNNNSIVSVGLGVIAAFLAFLVVAELFHAFGVGLYRFHPLIIFEIYTIWNILQLAYERNPESEDED